MDRQGQERPGSLLHIESTEDGGIWSVHQRAARARAHQHPPEAVRRQDELEGQDPPDSCQQLSRKLHLNMV